SGTTTTRPTGSYSLMVNYSGSSTTITIQASATGYIPASLPPFSISNGAGASGKNFALTPKGNTTTTITTDLSAATLVGQGYTVEVTVAKISGSGTPSGTVTITDGTDNCITGPLIGGTVSCTLTSTTVGSKTITATYPGDASFNTSSGTKPHTVNNPTPTISNINPTSGSRLQTLDIVFTGSGYISGVTTVGFGLNITVNSTTVNSATQLTANITISTAAATGSRTVTVTNP